MIGPYTVTDTGEDGLDALYKKMRESLIFVSRVEERERGGGEKERRERRGGEREEREREGERVRGFSLKWKSVP
jgi:hypothetical protein